MYKLLDFTTTLLLSVLIPPSCGAPPPPPPPSAPPNVILLLADDLGYGDLSCYGHPSQEAGVIDDLAREGIRFTQMYSAATFCTPSRAALLTGRQPFRTGLIGPDAVLLPSHRVGLPLEEVTIAEVLKDHGYRTGMVGKWHQGINRDSPTDGYYLPSRQGFDFVGTILPFTLVRDCDNNRKKNPLGPSRHRCFAYHNTTPSQEPIQLEQLSSALLHDAQTFLHDTQEVERKPPPFFLYFSFPQVHTPMFNKEGFAGKSRRGTYGDQILEVDWVVGELLRTLDRIGARNNTLVLFSSDHGPHREAGLEGGITGGFKGGKGNHYEGGLRVPFIANWPGVISPGSLNHNVLSLMDLLPTMHSLTNSAPDPDILLDGESFAHLLRSNTNNDDNNDNNNENTKTDKDSVYKNDNSDNNNNHTATKRRFLPIFCDQILMSVRYGEFKLHYRTMQFASEDELVNNGPRRKWNWYKSETCKKSHEQNPPLLFNIDHDPGETFPLELPEYLDIYFEIVNELESYLKTLPVTWSEPLLSRRFHAPRRVMPCCNPPFCVCVDSLLSKSVCPLNRG